MQLTRVTPWFRIASQRQDAARLLFASGFYIDAAYLAVYVVECALKGYLVWRIPKRRRHEFINERFVGQKAHDFEYLRWLASVVRASMPIDIVERLRRTTWSTELRYTAGMGNRNETQRIIETGEAILRWARNNT